MSFQQQSRIWTKNDRRYYNSDLASNVQNIFEERRAIMKLVEQERQKQYIEHINKYPDTGVGCNQIFPVCFTMFCLILFYFIFYFIF